MAGRRQPQAAHLAPASSPVQRPYLPPQQMCRVPGRTRRQESAWRAAAAGGLARTTRRLPPGRKFKITAGYMSEPAAHLIPDHRAAHGPAHHESDPGRLVVMRPGPAGARSAVRRPDRLPCRTAMVKSALPPHPCLRGEHQRRLRRASAGRARSGAEALAPLAPARSEHRPPGARAHAQAESVRPGPVAIVRLKCTLTHFWLQMRCFGSRPTARAAARALRRPGGQLTSVGAVIPAGQTGRRRAARRPGRTGPERQARSRAAPGTGRAHRSES